jgi:hypothetical protein
MPPAPARKHRPMLGGFESVVGAFGFGGRNNARSPTATSRTPKAVLMAALRVSLVEKPVSPDQDANGADDDEDDRGACGQGRSRAIGRSPVGVFSCSRKMTGLIAAPSASGMTSRSRLLIVPPTTDEAGTSWPPPADARGPTRICCATTSGATTAQWTCYSATSATRKRANAAQVVASWIQLIVK